MQKKKKICSDSNSALSKKIQSSSCCFVAFLIGMGKLASSSTVTEWCNPYFTKPDCWLSFFADQ